MKSGGNFSALHERFHVPMMFMHHNPILEENMSLTTKFLGAATAIVAASFAFSGSALADGMVKSVTPHQS